MTYLAACLWFSSLMGACGFAILAILYFGTWQPNRFLVCALACIGFAGVCWMLGRA